MASKAPRLAVRLLASFLFPVGVVLAAGGAWLIGLGGSPYYLAAGLAVLVAAVLVWRGDRRGAWVYGAMLAGTVVWALVESGLDGWALAPRLIGPAVVGACFLLPPVQRGLLPHLSPVLRLLRAALLAPVAVSMVALVIAGAWPHQPADAVFADSGSRDPTAAGVPDGDWPAYGRSSGGTRFSPLAEIDPGNVGRLAVAWTFRTGPTPPGLTATLETTPLKVGDTLYLCNGVNTVFALDAVTGRQVWRFDPKADTRGLLVATCRGVAYHRVAGVAPDAPCAARIYTTTVDARLIALDAATGRPCAGFGTGGAVDLSVGLGRYTRGYYMNTSPPTVVRGRVVLGGWVTDNQSVGEPSGVVRAFDAATGALAWAWDIGRPDRSGAPAAGERYTPGTPNAWAPASADEALGLVYLPMGNPTPDFWGGARTPAMDRYGSAVVALDAETGKVRWSFQTTHHDLWDYDIASQPTLVDWPVGGASVPALIQPTKRGALFVLDRRTGRPLVPVVERPVPGGPAPGDRLSSTQPFSAMPSFTGPPLTEAMMWGLTPIDQLWCRIRFRQARYDGIFTPPGLRPTIEYPGYSGGFSWGGVAVDPERRLMLVNVNHFAQYGRLVPRAEADARGMRAYTGTAGGAKAGEEALEKPQLGTPFAVEMNPFMSPLGMPCQQPPYGTIAGVDLASRRVLWQRPFGNAHDSGPLGTSLRLGLPLGTPNLGGAMVTRGGLAFIAATQERAFRAIDLASGKLLWQARLPAGGNATPMSYRGADGRQYVVIAAGGNVLLGGPPGDYIIAYALPPAR